MTKTAALTSGLIITKGGAMPTPAVASEVAAVASDSPRAAKDSPPYHKALTLKLDAQRYRALKTAGLELDASSQDILVQALDLWLKQRGQ